MILQYEPEYDGNEAKALYDLVISGSWLSDHKKTLEFEQELLKNTDKLNYCHVVNNGTIALSLALLAGGIKPGDKVAVPNLTMIATATAVSFIGAIPIFFDVNYDSGCLDVNSIIENYNKNKDLKSVIYVTLNGRSEEKNLLDLYTFCLENKIILIKDDAQSYGSKTESNTCLQSYRYADFHTLSFSPHKIVSCGQGGAILTSSKYLSDKIATLKDFGRLSGGSDIHDYFGINSKFTEMQAVVGLEQLLKFQYRALKKKYIYDHYYFLLKDLHLIKARKNETPWFVDIYLPSERVRDSLFDYLQSKEIHTRKMYPALTSQKIYYSEKNIGKNANLLAKTGLWLPSSFNLSDKDIENISDEIRSFIF